MSDEIKQVKITGAYSTRSGLVSVPMDFTCSIADNDYGRTLFISSSVGMCAIPFEPLAKYLEKKGAKYGCYEDR